jgi:gliding motility-associated protein GldM
LVDESNEKTKRTPHDFTQVIDLLDRSFTYNEKVINSEGTEQNYLNYNFEGFPLIASLSKFTKLQSDIRELELQMVEALIDKIKSDGSAVNINTSKTLLDAQPSYYVGQSTSDAKIIVGRIDGNFVPDSVALQIGNQKLVKGRDFTIGGGAVNIKRVFRLAGEKKITGNLYFREANGSLSPIPVEQSLIINNKTDFFVELPKMNILYRGLPNEVRITDPEIQTNNLRVSSKGAKTKAIGNSTWKVYPNSLKDLEIVISDNSNSKVRKTKSFRVKNLPEMESAILYNGKFFLGSDGISKRGLVRGTVTGSKPDDFDYDLIIKVESFDFQIGSAPTRSVKGDKLRSLSAIIETQNPGQVAFFSNIVSTAFSEGDGEPIPNVKVRDFSIKLK